MRIKRWRQWMVLAAFIVTIALTGLFAFRTVRKALYWHYHTDEPIHGWMSVGYVAHSYHVPPHVLYIALGLPHNRPDKRPLREIAREQNRSMDEVRALLISAITHARPPNPSPLPPADDAKSGAARGGRAP